MKCHIHGEVEGYNETEGALSSCWPYPVLCEKCPPGTTIIGYEDENDREVDSIGDPVA